MLLKVRALALTVIKADADVVNTAWAKYSCSRCYITQCESLTAELSTERRSLLAPSLLTPLYGRRLLGRVLRGIASTCGVWTL